VQILVLVLDRAGASAFPFSIFHPLSSSVAALSRCGLSWLSLKHDALPFEPGMFKIQNQAHLEFRDAEVVQHLAALMVSDTIDDFGIDDHLVERN
jgi:hypothetical protein